VEETAWTSWLAERETEHLNELFTFLRIPSISSLPEHRGDVRRAAEWVVDRLSRAGVPEVELLETGGHPLVTGQWHVSDDLPTVMIYAHYDVQPPDPLDLWTSPPFMPEIRDGRIYARGAGDDKAGLLITILAVEALVAKSGAPPVNLRFFFEGEEEIGSPSVAPYIRQHRDRFACDFVMSADGLMWDEETPSVMVSVKGMAGCEIALRTASTDMHSGIYGGSVRNAAQAMAELAATLHDRSGRVAVEGFYDRVIDPIDEERRELEAVPFDEARYFGQVGAGALWGEPGYSPLERLWMRPTLDINGLWSGFQGEGTKTVTPAEARLKITCRLVPDQDPENILDLIERHVERHCPTGATFTFTRRTGTARPYAIPRDHPGLVAAAETLRGLFRKEPAVVRIGGTIPIAEVFKGELGADLVFFAWSQTDCNAHAPNEWFRLEDFRNGTAATCAFLERVSRRAPVG
jgi:acetylornithine deacetylase/succinyl-diaminopimelate desuccinylase-like protein